MLSIDPVQIVLDHHVHQRVRLGRLGAWHGSERPRACLRTRASLRSSLRCSLRTTVRPSLRRSRRSRVRAHAYGDDAIRFGKRERPKSDGVDEGEDRGGGAGAEGEHDQRADREAGRGSQCADGVTQIDHDAIERERARRTARRRFMPVRLAQRAEQGFEASAAELGPRGLRRVFGRRALRHELLPSILEVLRQFFDDLALAHRRQAQRLEAWTDVRLPVRHVHLA